ncbi:hypothetical protein CPB97_007044 [Podila verticillata]|nr:hypothetical protein CPB97_007044 [Podila verticillata]
MVRLSLSLLFAATVVTLASATPYYGQHRFSGYPADYKCLPDTQIKEYHPFQLFSHDLDTYVSKRIGANLLMGGVNGDKTFQQLQLCVVSLDDESARPQFRPLLQPSQGYLRTNGGRVDIVKHGVDASYFRLSRDDDDWGLRIAPVREYEGQDSVLATTKAGNPISLTRRKKSDVSQFFDLEKPGKASLDVGCAI